MTTDKQNMFCREYVIDYNATQAAIRAGYSKKTASVQASRLLKKAEVLEKIKENQRLVLEQSCLSEEKIINFIQEVFEKCMADKPKLKWNYDKHAYEESGFYEFDSKGALNALKLLGQHIGMFEKKVDNESDENDCGIVLMPEIDMNVNEESVVQEIGVE